MFRAALALGLAFPALAQTRVGVIASPTGDGVGPEVAARIDAALSARLKELGHVAISSSEVANRVKRHAELRSCARAECLDRIADLVQAARVVGAETRREGTALEVRVWVYDPAVHASVTGKDACTSCGLDRAAALAASALDQALASDARRFQPVSLAIGSQPGGATVRLDGRPAGVTPLRLRLSPGSHQVEIALEGYERQTRDLDAEGGAELELNFPLVPTAPVRRYSPALKWMAWGGAVVAVVAGSVLLAADGGDVGDANGAVEGRDVRASRAEGLVLVGVGIVLGGTGAALWWLE